MTTSTSITINTELTNAHKTGTKIAILTGDDTFCYEDCIIQHIGRNTITFITPEFKTDGREVIKRYTINKKLITGVGVVIASLHIESEDDDKWTDIWM